MPRREEEASPRPMEQHLDEGTAHAWLDGALPPDEAARVAAHVAGCAPCAELVAEAQGLLAGASRILGALDAVPGGVVPRDPAREAARDAALSAALAAAAAERRPAVRARRAWFAGVPARAAAAVLVVAGLAATLARVDGGRQAGTEDAAAEASFDTVAATATAAPPGGPRAEDQSARDVGAPAPALPRGAAHEAPPAAPPAPAPPPARAPSSAAQLAKALDPASTADSMRARQAFPVTAPAEAAVRAAVGNAVASLAPAAAPTAPAPAPPAAAERGRPAASTAGAPTGVVVGQVTTSDGGAPLPGAQVQVAGAATGALTDDAGRFELRVAPGTVTLQVRRVGFAMQTASVAVGESDTARVPVALRAQSVALSAVVGAGAAPPGTRRLAGAPADSTAAQRADALLEDARRTGTARVLTAAGCYALSAEPGGPSPFGVARLSLEERPTTRRAGRQSYAARLLPSGPAAEWTPLPGDSLRVAWPSGAGSVVLRLAPAGGTLRGTAQPVGADGVAGAAQGVTARRTPCEPDPVR